MKQATLCLHEKSCPDQWRKLYYNFFEIMTIKKHMRKLDRSKCNSQKTANNKGALSDYLFVELPRAVAAAKQSNWLQTVVRNVFK